MKKKFCLSLLAFYCLSCEDPLSPEPMPPPNHQLTPERLDLSKELVIKGSFFTKPEDLTKGGEKTESTNQKAPLERESYLSHWLRRGHLARPAFFPINSSGGTAIDPLVNSPVDSSVNSFSSSSDPSPFNGKAFFQTFKHWIGEEEASQLQDAKEVSIDSNLQLTGDTIIMGKKVFLNMALIETFEHHLLIMADEFVSRHSLIRNFPPSLETEKKQEGKAGGNIWILTQTAVGDLRLILNGLNGGAVPNRGKLSRRERRQIIGRDGADGSDAVYKLVCRPLDYHIFESETCEWLCDEPPERGEPGERGQRGIAGPDGKRGGDSGSFLLSAFELDNFRLSHVQKLPGEGSPGGRGSDGGFGGKGGKAGRDDAGLCAQQVSHQRIEGNKGERGPHGKTGENGHTGFVCLEKRFLSENQSLHVNHICL